MSRILVVDDEETIRDSVSMHLKRSGHDVATAANYREGVDALAGEAFHLVITDLKLPGGDGIGIVGESRKAAPDVPVIVITAYATVDTAVEAMKRGAFDYIQKPFKLDQLEVLIERALSHRQLAMENEYLRARVGDDVDYVWGPSRAMNALLEKLRSVAASESTVLISGETGTGKEVVAKTLHRMSPRGGRPYLAVNCAALSAGLLESELFGHEKGAFTGADRMRRGRFELAESGTLLLDEVSEIDMGLQAKLLRVLQERTFERVGSSQARRADVRVVATTNRDLAKAVADGKFRQDLYFRLNVVPVEVPPLRERREDLPALVKHLFKRMGVAKEVDSEAMKRLQEYEWPGNVRELANVLERAAVLSKSPAIDAALVTPWLSGVRRNDPAAVESMAGMSLEEVEMRLIEATLRKCHNNKEAAAKMLGISSRTLRDKLKKP